MRRLGAIAFSVLLFCMAGAACAQDLAKPMLLVANPSLRGVYGHTALLAMPAGDKHFGFILNRATNLTMAQLYPEHAPSAKVQDPVYFGGPEVSNALFVLTPRDPGKPSTHLFGDVYMTGSAQVIDRVIEETPNEARYFAGFVAWQAEELAAEIEAGYWYVGAADEALIFRHDTASLWDELVERLRSDHHAALTE